MGLFENMNTEPVKNLNLREPVLAKPEESVREVASAMRGKNIGCAVLVDDNRTPVGMFTESMLTQIVANKACGLDEPVSAHAVDRWAQLSILDPIVSVLEALEIKNVRFLSVVDESGRVCGLAGQKGLMEYVADHFPGQVMVQRVGQNLSMQKREGA